MEIQGTLEKKVARPFGLTAWQPRDVTLEEDALVVRNAKRPADTKRYPFAFVALESSVAAPGARLAFALLDEDGATKLTLAVETKFAHRRWTRAIQERMEAQRVRESEPAPPRAALGDSTNKVRLVNAGKPASPASPAASFGETSESELTPAPRAVAEPALSTKKLTPEGAKVITYARGAHAAAGPPAEPEVSKADRARGLVAGKMECAVSEEAVVVEAVEPEAPPAEEKFAALSNLFGARAPPVEPPKEEKFAAPSNLFGARAPPAPTPEPASEPELPKEEKFAALSNLFGARTPPAPTPEPASEPAEAPKENTHAALSNLFAARAAPPQPKKMEKGAFASLGALFACRKVPPSPTPYERFSLTFETGPLGIKLDDAERPLVLEVTADSEHRVALNAGDEVVGIGATSFFETEAEVARGGDSVFSTDDCYDLLADAVERKAFPLTIHFRRRREGASKPTTPVGAVQAPTLAPVDDAVLEPYLKIGKLCGAERAVHKATMQGLLDANGMATLRLRLGLKPPTPAKKASEEPIDESKLFAAKKKKKVGVPNEKIMQQARQEGHSHATLVAIAQAIGAPPPTSPTAASKGPQSTTKNIHWDGLSSPSIQRRKGSLWGRSGQRKRESLGARAESLFTENSAASDMLEEMFALAPAPKKKTADGAPREEKLQLLEGTVAQNLEITLAGLRDVKPWPHKEEESSDAIVLGLNDCRALCEDSPGLVRALVATGLGSNDERCAAPDVLRRLVANLPGANLQAFPDGGEEECRKVAEAAARAPAGTKFNKATAFVVAVHAFGLVRFKACLTGAAACGEAPAELEACTQAAQSAAEACRLAREEPLLRAACHAALALGNRLNQGSRRGSAVAVRLVDLTKLSQTKGKGGKTAMDYLARVLEDDAFDREEGLDGAEIDTALRVIAPKLKAGADLLVSDKTTDVKQREMQALSALDAFVKTCKPKKGLDADALKAFVRGVPDASKPAREALKAAKVALDAMAKEQTALREYVGDDRADPREVLEAIASFSTKLVASRKKLMKELGSTSRRSSCTAAA